MRECALHDDLRPGIHGSQRLGYRSVGYLDAIDPHDLEASSLEMFDKGVFVRSAALGKYLEKRVPDLGLGKGALGHCAIEIGQMPAVEMTDKITGANLKRITCLPHSIRIRRQVRRSKG